MPVSSQSLKHYNVKLNESKKNGWQHKRRKRKTQSCSQIGGAVAFDNFLKLDTNGGVPAVAGVGGRAAYNHFNYADGSELL